MTCQSPRCRPAAWIWISTSLPAGTGWPMSASSRTSAEPYRSWTMACIVVSRPVTGLCPWSAITGPVGLLGGTWGGFLGWTPAVMRVIVRGAAGAFPCSCSRSQNRGIMSMQPQPWPEVPAGTAKTARRAFRKGSLAMRARDELGAWCQDEGFSGAYGTRGAPGISPAQLAMVTVLQFTADLTGRQAADAVRGRLDREVLPGPGAGRSGVRFQRAERVPVPAGGRRDGGGAAGGAAGPAGRARPGRGGDAAADRFHPCAGADPGGEPAGAGRGDGAGGAGGAGGRRAGLAGPGDRRVLAAGLRAADRRPAAARRQGGPRGPGGAVRPGRLPPAAEGPRPGCAGLAAGPARGAGAAPGLDPAVLPGRRRGRGEGDLAGGRAGPPAGQIPAGLAV